MGVKLLEVGPIFYSGVRALCQRDRCGVGKTFACLLLEAGSHARSPSLLPSQQNLQL